jgi:hypothetical protein
MWRHILEDGILHSFLMLGTEYYEHKIVIMINWFEGSRPLSSLFGPEAVGTQEIYTKIISLYCYSRAHFILRDLLEFVSSRVSS